MARRRAPVSVDVRRQATVLELTSNYLPAVLQVTSRYIPFVALTVGIAVSIYGVVRPTIAFVRHEERRIGVLVRSVVSLTVWVVISYVMANAFLVGLWLGGWDASPRSQADADKGQLILVLFSAAYLVTGALLVFWVNRYGRRKPVGATDGA